MARQDEGFDERTTSDIRASGSGTAPGESENLPNWLAHFLRAVQGLGWALPDSPQLLPVTARAFRVRR